MTPRFRCYSCLLAVRGPRGERTWHEFESEDESPSCPKCETSDQVYLLEDVHFMMPCKQGPILSGGKRYKIACDPDREVLAESIEDTYAASGDASAVSCPRCMAVPEYAAALKYAVAPKSRKLIDPFKGCC